MRRVVWCVACATAFGPRSGPHAAADVAAITDVVPADVGADATFEVRGAGLALQGLTAKLLTPVDHAGGNSAAFRRAPLGVVSVADDRVVLRVRTATVGEAFVLLADAHGRRSITSALPIRIHAPAPESTTPSTAAPRDSTVVSGKWLGARGTLRIGGVRARVTSWTDDAITAVVPSKATNGLHFVEVRNKVGYAASTGGLEVRDGRDAPAGEFVVRDRSAKRSYVVRTATYDEATGSVDVYASRLGPIRRHHAAGFYYWVCTNPYEFICFTGYWAWYPAEDWTTQSVRDIRLLASGASFDAEGRAIVSAMVFKTTHTDQGKAAHGKRETSSSIYGTALFRRAPDGALSGSFSGPDNGRLFEGSFRSQP